MEKVLNKTSVFNIVDLFFEAAQKQPQKQAIIEPKKAILFTELAQQVNERSAYYQAKGITKGDRVLVFVPMSIDLYATVLALFNIGATAVFLDEWVSKKRLEKCCEIAQCKAFIGGWKVRMLSIFSSELRRIPLHLGLTYSSSKRQFTRPMVSKTDTALITFTTGSTGTPKAAKRTHGFLKEQFDALVEKINPQVGDIDMPILPIVLLLNLGIGCTSVIADFNARKPASLKANRILQQIKNHSVNRLVASPFVVKKLAEYVVQYKLEIPSLKNIFTGGAPVFPMEARLYKTAFLKANIEIVYGSTEAEPISSIRVGDLVSSKRKDGLAVGIPSNRIDLKIISISDKNISCSTKLDLEKLEQPVHSLGEIIVSGAHVLDAYLNNPEALQRNKIFIDGICWHRTGDSGFVDLDGRLFLTGRCKTLIYTADGIIAPFIFENLLQQINGVEIGTIVQKNKQVLAVVELNDLFKKEFIRETILTMDNRIQAVRFMDRIPRDPRHFSKIAYEELV